MRLFGEGVRTERGANDNLFPRDSFNENSLRNGQETSDIDPQSLGEAFLELVNNGTNFLQISAGLEASSNSTASPNTMILVDEKGLEVVPFDNLLETLLLALSVTFIVVGGAIPYVFQYAEIYQRKSAAGFSLLVCLALCIANILRIEFWIGKKFETPLLVQSVIMLMVMVAMLEISVRMNRRMIPVTQRTSVWNGDLIDAFWKWNDLSSFIAALVAFTAVVSLFTAFLYDNAVFVETLGMSALMVEACLGLPQLVRNFQRKSTIGMSVKMVLMWFIGDLGKTLYFVVRKSPAQFWICSCLQITIDVLILLQVWAYGRRASNAARIPSYVSETAKA